SDFSTKPCGTADHLIIEHARAHSTHKHQVAYLLYIDTGGQEIYCDGDIGVLFILVAFDLIFRLIRFTRNLCYGIIRHRYTRSVKLFFKNFDDHVCMLVSRSKNQGFRFPVWIYVVYEFPEYRAVKILGNDTPVKTRNIELQLIFQFFQLYNLVTFFVVYRRFFTLLPDNTFLGQLG